MEGWRQERLGSRAGTHREEEKNKNILTGKEKRKNILDTRRPSHGRHWELKSDARWKARRQTVSGFAPVN